MSNRTNSIVDSSRVTRPAGASSWLLVLAEVIALGLVVAAAAGTFAMRDAMAIVTAMTVAYLVPRFVYSRGSFACRWGQWWLLAVALALAIYAIYSIKMCTLEAGYSLEMPHLVADDGRYYKWALHHYDGRCPEPKLSFKGLPLFMLWLWHLLGVSIVWPIALNYMFTLLTIVFTGKLACRLLCSKFPETSPSTIAAVAMLLISLMGFFISQGVRIQKEAACALGMTLVGYTLAGLMSGKSLNRRDNYRNLAIFTIGCLLLAMVRTNFTYFAIVGAIMMAFANHRAQWKPASAMAVIAAIITVSFSLLFSYSYGQQLRTVDGGDAMAQAFKVGIIQQPYLVIMGDYFHYPEWKRLLLLPVTAGVQYIIPFPWLYEGSIINALSVLPRVRLMWYFVGGVCLHYYLFITIVHYKQSNLGMWAWWPPVVFLIIAYITGGSVSRYILPMQPLFVVIALYVLLKVKHGNYRRSFTIWMIVYTFILIAVLIMCYNTQLEYLESLDNYYRMKATHQL